MFSKMFIIFTFSTLSINLISTAAVYDQSQSGRLNVQVDLKDLNFFAILKGDKKEEYVDYDYAYDYSEMTIKPHGHKSTTTKPANGTISTTATYNVSQDSQENATMKATEQTTEAIKRTTLISLEPIEIPLNTTIKNYTRPAATSEATIVNATSTPPVALEITTKSSNSTGCKKGFGVNQKGECEIRLQGTGNALLKLVKLSQKLKLRRENKGN